MLKTFKNIVSEVAEPRSEGEKNFKNLHAPAINKDLVPGVTDQDHIFKGHDRKMDQPTASYEIYKSEDESKENYDKGLTSEATLSAKAARAGKDIGKPGKNFAKIAASAAERYGSKEAGQKVAGAILKKMRAEEVEHIEERVDPKDYTVTSEPSKLKAGGHRPMVVHKDKGTTMYLGQTSYSSPEHAKGHAKAYLGGYAMGGDVHAMRKGNEYQKANAKHVVEEIEAIDEISKQTLQSYRTKALAHKTGNLINVSPEERAAKILKTQNRDKGKATSWKKMTHQGVKVNATEEVELDEKTLTSAEMKKREEVVKAIKRENPKMDKSMAYAIATKTAKRVAEASDTFAKDNKEFIAKDYMNKNAKFANARTAEVGKVVKHDCAKHVAHEEWGVGTCIPGEHTIVESADGEGYVTHYDVMFDHGIEANVPVEDLKILVSETHEHTRKGMKEDIDYDYEGEMAKAELRAICDKADALADMMTNEMQLEAWLQSKITKAKYMIDSVYDYLMYSDRNQAGTGPTPSTVTPSYNQSAAMTDTYGNFLNRMGEEVEYVEEKTDEKSFAALAEPKDKVTYADKIVGAKLQAAKEKARKKPAETSDTNTKEEVKEEIDLLIISDEEKARLEEIMKAE